MSIQRKLTRIERPIGQAGFLGAGHIARPVVSGSYSQTDPFIFMMDDMLNKKDSEPVGGPHPHAGFETVSLMLEGEIGDEQHTMQAGDFQIMTAGSGVVHTETIEKPSKLRLLQMWLNLPAKDRWTEPRVQDLAADNVPQLRKNGVSIKLYSGSLAGLQSPIQNYTPLLIADISIDANKETSLEIPANFNGFIYGLNNDVFVGEERQQLSQDQVGWLSITADEELSELKISAGENGARFVLYAAKPQGDPIVSHGPFIADTNENIMRLYKEYRAGKMKHIRIQSEKLKAGKTE